MSLKKDIRLKIKSTRYEVEASLFSDDESEEALTVRAEDADESPEIIEINSLGTLYDDGTELRSRMRRQRRREWKALRQRCHFCAHSRV